MSNDDNNVTAAKKPIWKNLGPRVVSALVFAVIFGLPLYIGGYVWTVLVLALGLRLIWEWVDISDKGRGPLALAIPMIGLILAIGYVATGQHNYLVIAVTLVTAILAAVERARRGGALWSGFGVLYIFAPTLLMIVLRGSEMGMSQGLSILLFIVLVVAGADVGAYFGGSALKGPKMAPKISPNKTWSGFFSGLILGTVIGIACGIFMDVPIGKSVAFSIPVVIFSVFGDFLESGFKRKLKVKDAGNLMPGHGGLLDRVDGLMMAIVGCAVMAVLLVVFGVRL